MKRKKTKSEFKKLYKEAWKFMSMYVRLRDNGTCFTCGKKDNWKNMNAGHFVHVNSMDFLPRNIHCQCVTCNKWKHGNLGVYAINLDKKYGEGTAEYLLNQKHKIVKLDREDLRNKIKNLKELISQLMSDKFMEEIKEG